MFFSLAVSSNATVKSASKTERLKQQIAVLEKEQSSLNAKIKQIKKKQGDAQDQLDQVNKLISNLEKQADLITTEIDELETDMAAIQEQIQKSKMAIIQRYKMLYIYDGLNFSYLRLLSEKPEDIVMVWGYLDMLSDYDEKTIALFEYAKIDFDEKKADLGIQRSLYDAKIAELDTQKKEAQALVDQIATEKKELEEKQKKIDEEMEEARSELNKLIYQITANSKNSEYVGGDFIWPLRNDRKMSSPFGPRWGRLHAGCDAGTPVGTPVYAANAGVVVVSKGGSSGYGNYIIIDHGGGKTTVYAHLSERLVSVGTVVAKDQLIAKSGNTGRSTGPHLHFEIRINGTAVNPLNYVTIPRKNS